MVDGDGRPGRYMMRIGGETGHVPSILLALVVGAAGGGMAKLVGAPLPWLLGSLLVITAGAVANVRPFGHTIGVPSPVRNGFIPIIGVSIGAGFTPSILDDAVRWWPTALALMVYIPVAHVIGYQIARRVGGTDRPTAYYGTMPGGFIESITLGDAAGADSAMLATMQFLRLILCIVMIPIGFSFATGGAVGSASGAVIGGGDHVLTGWEWVILAIVAAVGAIGGRFLKLPAGIIVGPILLSGLVHVLGWVEGGPPRWLVDVTQLVVGTTLGTRFAGRSPRILLNGLRITLVSIPLTLLLATGFAMSLHGVVGERWEAVFLAFAPGGLAEMALIAVSLQISVIYVTAHHVLRILIAVFVAQWAEARFLR